VIGLYDLKIQNLSQIIRRNLEKYPHRHPINHDDRSPGIERPENTEEIDVRLRVEPGDWSGKPAHQVFVNQKGWFRVLH